MAQKKRSSARKSSPKRKRFALRQISENPQQSLELSNTVQELAKALQALPLPARAIFDQQINSLDKFKRQYPRLYDVMFKNIDSKRYREFEQHLERAQVARRRTR